MAQNSDFMLIRMLPNNAVEVVSVNPQEKYPFKIIENVRVSSALYGSICNTNGMLGFSNSLLTRASYDRHEYEYASVWNVKPYELTVLGYKIGEQKIPMTTDLSKKLDGIKRDDELLLKTNDGKLEVIHNISKARRIYALFKDFGPKYR